MFVNLLQPLEINKHTCPKIPTGKNKYQTRLFAGLGQGLRLSLNTEQYAHTRWLSGSGVMVLLHDQRDVPRMGDLASIVTPGSHNVVSIKYRTVSIVSTW